MFHRDFIAKEYPLKPKNWELYLFRKKSWGIGASFAKLWHNSILQQLLKSTSPQPHLLPLEADSSVVGKWGNCWKEHCYEKHIVEKGGRLGKGRRRK